MRRVGRFARALLRFLAGVRRAPRGVPVHVVPGPPPHWVERVRQGAPGLLEPQPRDPVGPAQHASVDPAERATAAFVLHPPGERRVETGPRARHSPLRQLLRSAPRRVATVRVPEPSLSRRSYEPAVPEWPAPGPIVRDERPPEPAPPPAAAVADQAGPADRPARSPVVPRPRVRAVPPSRAVEPSSVRLAGPALDVAVSDTPGDSPWTGLDPRELTAPSRSASATLVAEPVVRPLLAAVVAAPERTSPEWPSAEPFVSAARKLTPVRALEPERSAATVGDRWPELPEPGTYHAVDHDTTLRALERARRIDREQAGL